MNNQIRKTIGRTSRSRLDRLRKLNMECLEGRRLMAVDSSPFHNYLIAEDVNLDFRVSPVDALTIINKINARNQELGGGEGEADGGYWDVNADGKLSPSDALLVINRLNGEGEGDILMRYSYSITNPTTGAPISQVTVGNEFLVNVFFQDVRAAATGIFSGAMDLGVSNLGLADYIFPTTFFSGLNFAPNFNAFPLGFRGGGLILGQDPSPSVQDGDTFSLTTSSGTVTFEFDTNASSTAGNTVITIPSSNATYKIVGDAVAAAVNASSLGITTARFNGLNKVNLPTGVTFNALTSAITLSSTANEYFDEIQAGDATPISPDGADVFLFYTVRFRATNPGTLTFNPNGPDELLLGSENNLHGAAGSQLPNNVIDFGSPFSINIVTDPTGPTANPDTIAVTEDVPRAITAAELLANDTSGATPARTLTLGSIQTIAGTTTGTLSGNTYTPQSNSNATDFLTYTVTDSTGLSSTATITINITPVNDQPVAVNDTTTAVAGSVDNDITVLANDTPGPANESTQTLTITAVSVPNNGGTATIAPGGRSVLYTPDPTFIGTETFTYTVQDSGNPAASSTATVTVDVQPATRPFAVANRFPVVEDSTGNVFNVLANDLVNVGQQALLVGINSNPANGSVSINTNNTATTSDDTILYTPAPNFFGTDTFTYAMNETNGTGANSIGTVTVTVNNVNDIPTLVNDPGVGVVIATEENAALTIPFSVLAANDSPGPNETDTLTPTQVTPITANAGTVAISGTNIIYTPASNFSGTFLFSYLAQDNGTPPQTATAPATVTVTVNPFNDPPVLATETINGTEDQNVTITFNTLLSNDSPGPGETTTQTLNVTSVAAVTTNAGSVAIVGTSVVYTPAANFNGPFLFTYTATDNGVPAKSSTITSTIVLAPVNDAPVPGADTVRAFKNNTQRIPFATLLANDTPGPANESTQTLTITGVQGATNGTVSVDNANSVVLFTPSSDFVGAASFQYTVQDNGGGTTNSAIGNVTVNVEEFLPSTIGGKVWVDETTDGVITPGELFLSGVEVHLTGTSLGQQVNQTAFTLSDGTYEFDELGPGSYQITFDAPKFAVLSTIFDEGPYSFTIAEPGGLDLTQDYSVFGIDAFMVVKLGRLMDQLVSRFQVVDPTIAYRGAYFALGADNSLQWGLKLAGFEDAIYTEAVFQGTDLLVTVVDAAHKLKTYKVSRDFYAFVQDAQGNKLVRLLGGASDLTNVVTTTLASPAYTASKYLESVREVFEFYDF